jgi:hypothetical protein
MNFKLKKKFQFFFVLIKNFHERSNLGRGSKGSVEVSELVEQLFIEAAFHQSSFSLKQLFIKAAFH